jgi:uncharacterized Tic20 family protein
MAQDSYPDRSPFTDQPPTAEPAGGLTSEEKTWAMFCHLSALICLFALGGMSFVGPLVCWLVKKDSSQFVDWHGKEALNYILVKFIAVAICIAGIFGTCGIGVFVFGPLLLVILVYSIVVWIIAGIRANSGEYFRYPLVPRLIHK